MTIFVQYRGPSENGAAGETYPKIVFVRCGPRAPFSTVGGMEIDADVITRGTPVLGIVIRPEKGEVIAASSYRFALSAAADVTRADVSVNEGPWEACRKVSANVWEYHWSNFGAGFHQVVARFQAEDGSVYRTEPRRFQAGETR